MTDTLKSADRKDLYIIKNCLNEVANGVHIDDSEFETRLGVDKSEVEELLARVQSYLNPKGKR